MRRRKSREIALKMLYAYEMSQSNDIKEYLNSFWDFYPNCPDDIKEYAELLFNNTVARINKIDNIISEYIKNWKMERIALIDKNILRLATYELLYEALDKKIIINEAVEIAKKYGSSESYQFINAILDIISKKYIDNDYKVIKAKASK